MGEDTRSRIEKLLLAKRFGAFSVNPSEVDTVIQYISNQHNHHAKRTFQEEYPGLF